MAGRFRGRIAVIALMAFAAATLGWLAFIGAFDTRLYHEVPVTGPAAHRRPDVAAIFISGDLGFRIGLGPEIAHRIAAAGIPVTGVNSLATFRERRTPTEIRAVVEQVIAHARARSGARRLVLIGQSFGADMLHVALSLMPPEEERDIILVAFVVPTDTVYYRISPREMLEWGTPDARAVDTAGRVDWVPAICIQGREESNSLCPLLRQPNMRHVALPGGHLLDHDPGPVSDALLQAIQSASGRKPSPQG